MDKLEQINQKVQEKVNNCQSQIIVGVYRNLVNSHNDFCDCNYCSILKKYVTLKKGLCAFNKNFRWSGDFYSEEDYFEYNDKYDFQKSAYKAKISQLKKKKNSLKVVI